MGDGAACPSAAGAAACSLTTAPIFLDEYSTTTGLKLQTVPLPTSISMGASDPFIGALSRCGDGSCERERRSCVCPRVGRRRAQQREQRQAVCARRQRGASGESSDAHSGARDDSGGEHSLA